MRVAAPALGPVFLIELRVLLAGLALLGYAGARRQLPPLREHWRNYLVIGAINSAIPFVLISTAELRLPASLAATLNATTPLFGSLVALAGLGPVPLTGAALWSMGASLLAAASYGVAAVYTKVKVKGGQPQALAMYSQLFAALVLLPVVPFAVPQAVPAAPVVVSVALLALLCTAFAYLVYFYLIVHAGPTRATMVTYLSPAFGMLWGVLFLHESLGIGSLVGFALILGSVALTSR